MAIVVFNTSPEIVQSFTGDPNLLNAAVDGLRVPSYPTNTAYFETLRFTLAMLRDRPGRRSIIAFTDGYDNRSTARAQDRAQVEAQAAAMSVPLLTIGYGDAGVDIEEAERLRDGASLRRALDATTMKSLADSTGGVSLTSPRADDLRRMFQEAAKQALGRFPLTYICPNAERGGEHQVRIAVKHRGRVYELETAYRYGVFGVEARQHAEPEELKTLLWMMLMAGLVCYSLPYIGREILWRSRKRAIYAANTTDCAAVLAAGYDRSPVSDVRFADYPNEPVILCPRDRQPHLLRDWEANEGCARGDFVMRKPTGLSAWMQVYYGTLIGATGGLIGWAGSWMVLIPYLTEQNILVANALLVALLGAVMGAFIGSLNAIFQQVPLRSLVEAALGAALGCFAGALGSFVSEWAYEGTATFLRAGWMGRMLGWAIVGTLLGLSQGLYGRYFVAQRAYRGMLGGCLGGALGGLAFQWLSQGDAPLEVGRIAFAAVGLLMGFGITLSLNVGRFWIVLVQGNSPKGEVPLYATAKDQTIGSDPSCHVWVKFDPEVAPVHASVSFASSAFYLTDMSQAASVSGSPASYQPARLNQVQCQPGRPRALHDSDEIRIGNTILRFEQRDQQA